MQYDPFIAPDAKTWLEIDEELRLMAMEEWAAEYYSDDDHFDRLVPMLVVENQLAADEPPEARATMDRLQADGLDRFTALVAMARVVAKLAFDLLDAPSDAAIDANAELTGGYAALDPQQIAEEVESAIDDAAAMEEESFEDFRDRLLAELPAIDAALQPILDDFAERHADAGSLGFAESAGFFFGLHACPELVMPSQWTEIVQGEAIFDDQDEAQRVMDARMQLYNWVGECCERDLPPLPPGCAPADDPMIDVDEATGFSRWCRGAVIAHGWLFESWRDVVPEDSDEDRAVGMTALVLSFFMSREHAERVAAELELAPDEMASMAGAFRFGILDSLIDYLEVGRRFRLPEGPAPSSAGPAPARSTKVGRNEPCPCGSGRKYKKCCGSPRSVH